MTISVKQDYSLRLGSLVTQWDTLGIDAYVQPTNDEFQSEYPPDSAKRLQWLSGFTGSAGMGVFFREPLEGKRAALFTDGRYTLQAGQQLDAADYQVVNSAQTAFETWLVGILNRDSREGGNPETTRQPQDSRLRGNDGFRLAYDPWLHTAAQVRRWRKAFEGAGIELVALAANPVDAVWADRPPVPREAVKAHPMDHAGESSESKRRRLADGIKAKGADAALLCLPDGINWLLNIRGEDIAYNPLLLSFALLHADASVTLYLHEREIAPGVLDDAVSCVAMGELVASRMSEQAAPPHPNPLPTGERGRASDAVTEGEKALSPSGRGWGEGAAPFTGLSTILYDPTVTADWFRETMEQAGITLIEDKDPTLLPKACKNAAEIEGMREAHRRDGRALTRFLRWLDEAVPKGGVTELSAEETLEAMRREMGGALYKGPSFSTISGAGPNGAIVHYRATEESNRTLGMNEIYLVDSGGQYDDGTTDVTRTVVHGMPTAEMKDRFTRVLKGHIALATAVFPEGTTGAQLDALARQYLWQAGVDYDHGTGHGVGAYLCVHEGPQRISKRGSDVALQPGMIISNEPGYYKAGEYGIRIENLVLVVEHAVVDGTRWFAFETLTLAPIDQRLVDEALMTVAETRWLEEYHRRVAGNATLSRA